METFTRGGLEFDVTDSGPPEGRPVLLLHGFPEDRHCWDRVAAALAEAGYRTLAPDQRGYSPGARPRGRRAYRVHELVCDVLALADAAGAARFDLVGHDLGAMVAWDLAARHPGRVRSLTVLGAPHPSAMLASLARSTQALRSWYIAALQAPELAERVLAFRGGRVAAAVLEGSGLDPLIARRYAGRLASPAATGMLGWYRAIPLWVHRRTPPVAAPTLDLWADRDRFITRTAAQGSARQVSGPYRLEVLAGNSHWLPTEAPGRLAPLLLEHLSAT